MVVAEIPLIAERQHDVFTAAQAVEAGWTLRQVRRHRESGRWIRVCGDGLAARGTDTVIAPVTGEQWFPARMLASAAQLTWHEAVVCRRVAAAVHGWPVAADGRVDVLSHPGRRPRLRLHPHAPNHPPDEPGCVEDVEGVEGDSAGGSAPVLVDGLRVTGPRRTAADCLMLLPFGEALDLYAWLSSRNKLSVADIAAFAETREALPGVVQLRRLVEVIGAGAASSAESRLHDVLRSAKIVGWQAGVPVCVNGRIIAVPDLLFERERVVVEVDGRRAHSGAEAFQNDRSRQNALMAAGYLVLRFTWEDVSTRAYAVVATIRQALAQRRS
jgi:very-short-patch-repair endonuclease